MEHSAQVEIPLLSLLPFVLMLLSIAVFPLFWNHFWEKNRNKLYVAITLSIPVIIYLLANGFSHQLIHTMVFDYVPFLILLGALFTITGGIFLTGDIEAKPSINTLFLGIGAVLASFMGTTGAAMLLIRPVIQTNKERTFKVHTILFFIGIVANCGGLLTPLGDPPLFMMYLRGAPFTWFFHLVPEWFITNALLLITYFFVDSFYHKKEPASAI
ncbi:MAG: sodium:proton antiporter, partial [Ignavibacteria bacterium]|nr:sodium:proton antiporter [Ignavibacteria bacterium]